MNPDDLELWTIAQTTFRYTVPINMRRRTTEIREMRAWCKTRFGSNRLLTDDAGVVWVSRGTAWRHHGGAMSFRDPNHALEFKMRWGGV